MAVNPLQMILAEPVTALQRGRQAGFQDRAMQRRELEEDRAIEQRNRLDELYRGITPESNREEVVQQAGQIAGMEGADRFSNYFAGLDANKQAQVKAEYENIARTIAQIDSLPPEQQQGAYDQVAQQLPQDWQGLPYRQARGRAVAMIAPADKLFGNEARVPTSIQEFQYAQQNPAYMQYRTQIAQAGARPQYGTYQGTPIQFTGNGFVPVGQAGTQPIPVVGIGQPIGGSTVDAQTGEIDPTIAALPIEEQNKAYRNMAMGRPFHIQNGQVVEGLSSGQTPETDLRGTIYELDAPPIEISPKIKGVWPGLTPEQRRQAVEQEAGIRPAPKAGSEGGIPSISSKDATTARLKLNQVQTARQQLERVKQQFAAIQNTFSAGGFGQGMVPTEAGQQFDRAVAQLNPLITAITRVPGVGAMSDYETRLQQAAMPARGNYESTTIEQLQGIEQMLNQVEEGYRMLLNQPAQGSSADIDALLEKYK